MTKLNERVEKTQSNNEVYVLTVSINNEDDIAEAFTKIFRDKKLAVEYVKNFVNEIKGGFDNCQVDYGKDYTYTDITAGDYSEYYADLSIEKQSVIDNESEF